MRVAVFHSRYRVRGGEDAVVEAETAALRAAGIEVTLVDPDSAAFEALSATAKTGIALRATEHRHGRELVARAFDGRPPDVAHFHNLYPHFGPGAIRTAAEAGCAVVQTVHNFRLSCIAGTHLYRGAICERCVPASHVPGVLRGCYRGSRSQSWVVARAETGHWRDLVAGVGPDLTLCVTEFGRSRLVAAGAPADAVVTHGNSAEPAPGLSFRERAGVLYAGRISPEKGIAALAAAWPAGEVLTVAGEGRLPAWTRGSVLALGAVSRQRARELMGAARLVVAPSLCYEGMPLSVLEALGAGTPVVGFRTGGLTEVLPAGWSVEPGDVGGFLDRCREVLDADERAWTAFSDQARTLWRERYSPETGVLRLLGHYETAIARANARGVA